MTNIAIRHFDDKDRVLDCLNKIDSSSQYLLSLLNDVLDINRIESGKMIISYEPMDIRSLINNCADIVDSLLIEKNVELLKVLECSAILCCWEMNCIYVGYSSIY